MGLKKEWNLCLNERLDINAEESASDNWELHLINTEKHFAPASATALAKIGGVKAVGVCSIIVGFEEEILRLWASVVQHSE